MVRCWIALALALAPLGCSRPNPAFVDSDGWTTEAMTGSTSEGGSTTEDPTIGSTTDETTEGSTTNAVECADTLPTDTAGPLGWTPNPCMYYTDLSRVQGECPADEGTQRFYVWYNKGDQTFYRCDSPCAQGSIELCPTPEFSLGAENANLKSFVEQIFPADACRYAAHERRTVDDALGTYCRTRSIALWDDEDVSAAPRLALAMFDLTPPEDLCDLQVTAIEDAQVVSCSADKASYGCSFVRAPADWCCDGAAELGGLTFAHAGGPAAHLVTDEFVELPGFRGFTYLVRLTQSAARCETSAVDWGWYMAR